MHDFSPYFIHVKLQFILLIMVYALEKQRQEDVDLFVYCGFVSTSSMIDRGLLLLIN